LIAPLDYSHLPRQSRFDNFDRLQPGISHHLQNQLWENRDAQPGFDKTENCRAVIGLVSRV
jgi:hypothetical protein